ncbi:MAG: CcdB family protein [Thermoanaerobaculia bacterium]|nr:CcdB family protein [Thermoanaerobaculia bacterium]
MAQFDVVANPRPETRREVPFLVVLQSDLLEPLATCVVAPLREPDTAPPVRTLMPVFRIDGRGLVMSTPELAGVLRSELGQTVGSLADRRGDIVAALDLLFTGI